MTSRKAHPPSRHGSDAGNDGKDGSIKALKQSEARYHAIVSATSDGIILQDCLGKILTWNREAERIFGIKASEVLGQTSLDFNWTTYREDGSAFPGSEHPSMLTLSTGKPCRAIVMGVLHPDGGFAWISVNTNPIFEEGKESPCAVVISFSDITEARKNEAALRASEARYRRITEGLTDYQYSVRVENGVAVESIHSPACASVTGYTVEEFASDPYLWISMVAPDHRELVRDRVQQILAGNEIPPIEHRIRRKKGDERWVVDTIIPHKDATGKLLAYDGVIKDITERKRLEEIMLARLQLSEHAIGARSGRTHPGGRRGRAPDWQLHRFLPFCGGRSEDVAASNVVRQHSATPLHGGGQRHPLRCGQGGCLGGLPAAAPPGDPQ